jgi:hypothetical protein
VLPTRNENNCTAKDVFGNYSYSTFSASNTWQVAD